MSASRAAVRWMRAALCCAALAACTFALRAAGDAGPVGTAPATAAAAVSAPAATAAAAPVAPAPDPAASLRARYATLAERLEQSPFGQRLDLESVESPHGLQGDIYALVDYPFATVSGAFSGAATWCDVLILHLNVKYCRAGLREQHPVLSVALGRKYDQPVSDAFQLEFAYAVTAAAADYLEVHLDAREGPLGTQDYRIAFAAVALAGGHTFLHLRYSYNYGLEGRVAMRTYLATVGSGKVGFTTTGAAGGGAPQFIGGARGVAERNTMRYYLAVDAYLGALATPAPQRFEQSLERWFSATERYARQLHELDHDAYLAMKRREYQRQQAAP
jgi:hypothetical protein